MSDIYLGWGPSENLDLSKSAILLHRCNGGHFWVERTPPPSRLLAPTPPPPFPTISQGGHKVFKGVSSDLDDRPCGFIIIIIIAPHICTMEIKSLSSKSQNKPLRWYPAVTNQRAVTREKQKSRFSCLVQNSWFGVWHVNDYGSSLNPCFNRAQLVKSEKSFTCSWTIGQSSLLQG